MPKFKAPINRLRMYGPKSYPWMVIAQIGNDLQTFTISAPLPPDLDSARRMLSIPEDAEIVVGMP